MGADDAVILTDAGLEGSDVWATAYAMRRRVAQARLRSARSSAASPTTAAPARCRARSPSISGLPCVTNARKVEIADGALEVERETDVGYQIVRAPLPALLDDRADLRRTALRIAQRHHGREEKDDCHDRRSADLALDRPVGRERLEDASCVQFAPPPARGKGSDGRSRRRSRGRAGHLRISSREEAGVAVKNVIVYVEHRQGATRKVTFELASEARASRRRASAARPTPSSSARAPRELAEQLRSYPLDAIYVNDDRRRRRLRARSGRRLSASRRAARRAVAAAHSQHALRPRRRRPSRGASGRRHRRRRGRRRRSTAAKSSAFRRRWAAP